MGGSIADRFAHVFAESGLMRMGVFDPGSVNLGAAGEDGLPGPIAFVYENGYGDIRYVAELLDRCRLGPSVTIFEPGFLRTTLVYHRTQILPDLRVIEAVRAFDSGLSYRVCMTSPAPRHRYTFREYLELEEVARVRHEFYQGEIYAMAGGTPEHAAMAAAITAILGRQLDPKSCRVYSSDLRVRVLATGLATYPDVTVVCGVSERDPDSATHVTNPKLLVEISSNSTADYDRGEKLQHYQQIPSLETVLIVDHQSERIDLWTRSAGVWQDRSFGTGEIVPLDAVSAVLPVDEVYAAARHA